jgi:sugar lactone lactonase YvrE
MKTIKVLQDGFGLVESPRWHGGEVWFADWIAGTVHALDPAGGEARTVLRVPTFPCCFDWLGDGRLVCTSGREARLVHEDGTTFANLAALSTEPWNEVVVSPAGHVFANCTGFDFPGGEYRPGFVAVVPADGGAPRVVAEGLAFPNGMAVIDGGATLVVAESYAGRLTAFEIDAGGSLSGRGVFADLGEGSAPDGISFDASGACWYASVPGQRCVRVAPGGAVLDVVEVDRGCFSCALGDGTLYITAARWGGPSGVGEGQLLAVPLGPAA